ncbi:hydrolase TatD [Alishewanella sp. d11]|uniref:hydrolase TatD n=1 Tax=Alishewanella sp. d11 TaxID=3414030 RepID=UPI003BF83AB4
MLSYLQQQRLTLQLGNMLPAAKSLLVLAGQTELAHRLTPNPTTVELLTVIEQAYQDGYEQHASTEFELQGIAFAGYGDPLLHLDRLAEVLPAFKAQRHGVPVTLVTYGLVAAAQQAELCQQLVELGVEKLEIFLPATNPPAYQQIVASQQYGFSEVCQFIHAAAEAGLLVTCFAYAPVKHAAELRA